jgi:ribokinase
MKPILVIGSYNTDLMVVGPRIPRPGETVLGRQFSMGPGGKGSNQAITVARLGGRVSFLARVGDDLFGRDALALFAREGIAVGHVTVDAGHHTGVALICVDDGGQNAIAVASGANYQVSNADLDRAAELFQPGAILLAQLETPLEVIHEAARRAHRAGMTVVLNPAPARNLPDDLLALVDVLTPNEHEATELSGIEVVDTDSARRAAERLRSLGPRDVIVTLGDRGVLWSGPDGHRTFSAYEVTAVDTTGAGDAFNGALAYALSAGRSMPESIDFASRAAALSVTRLGVVAGLPTLAQIEQHGWRTKQK